VHLSARSVVIGVAGGFVAALAGTIWTLTRLSPGSARMLLSGDTGSETGQAAAIRAPRRPLWIAAGLFVAALVSIGAALTGALNQAAAFFGAGGLLLVAALFVCHFFYHREPRGVLAGRGIGPIARLGVRSASFRPGRSVLSIGVIASATFILIAVDAFRREHVSETDARSGVGGYSLIVESLLPIVHDLASEDGRNELAVSGLQGTTVAAFRLRPGDDASCLNLYAPQSPRILGARPDFVAAGRFAFQTSAAATDEDRSNPWRLLERPLEGGVIPVIGDANSMTYVLHREVGEELVLTVGDRPVRLRFVAALRDSVFQSELVMSEANFRALFPEREGYQVWLVDLGGPGGPDGTPAAGRLADVSRELENALADYGADVTTASAKLAGFHRVENAYLSTFQTLGGLGLVIGTIGLAAVLLRNAFERRRELALLGAVGFRRHHVVAMLVAESLTWLAGGLAAGALSAGVAIAPALLERGGRVPLSTSGALLVAAVLVAGLISTAVAARLATRAPLLSALRSE